MNRDLAPRPTFWQPPIPKATATESTTARSTNAVRHASRPSPGRSTADGTRTLH